VEDGVFSHVVTNFGFTPGIEDKSGLQKIAKGTWKVLGEGGVAVGTTWAGMIPFSLGFVSLAPTTIVVRE
jgi:hypothetical protein